MKKVFAIVLILVMMITTLPVQATEINTINIKLSDELVSKLDCLDDDSKIDVVLWLKGIDDEKRHELLSSELDSEIKRGVLFEELIQNDSLTPIEQTDELSEQVQRYIEIKRKVEKSLHKNYNDSVIQSLASQYNSNAEIIYVSKYAPLVIAKISKSDIRKIALVPEVESIYYFNLEYPLFDEDIYEELHSTTCDMDLSDEDINIRSYPYGVWQSITNINVLRDALGYKGNGVNIGLVQNHIPDFNYSGLSTDMQNRLNEMFAYSNSHNLLHYIGSGSSYTSGIDHANYMLSILTGFVNNDYSGIAPLANVYCDEFSTSTGNFGPIENLVDAGVNVICASIAMGACGSSYDFNARFLDYIISNDYVTICISAGNNSDGITCEVHNGAMAYNAITSGNIDDKMTLSTDDDVIKSTSRYSSQDGTAYKPDLSSPGSRAGTYSHPGIVNENKGGTSASNAINAGICALLMQVNPSLKTNPMLLKSIVMSSANNILNMTNIYSNATSVIPALLRDYGAGMIDAYQAYYIISNNNFKSYNSYYLNYTYTFNVKQREVNQGKDIFLSLNWMQWITKTGSSYFSNSSYNVLNDFCHSLSLYDPNGYLVANSNYQYDKKQFIRYSPLQAGTYTVSINRTYINPPAYYPEFAIAYCIK